VVKEVYEVGDLVELINVIGVEYGFEVFKGHIFLVDKVWVSTTTFNPWIRVVDPLTLKFKFEMRAGRFQKYVKTQTR
jgi:hypothetical protein